MKQRPRICYTEADRAKAAIKARVILRESVRLDLGYHS